MSQRTVVDVNIPGAPYPALVQPGLLARVGPVLRELGIGIGRRICIVTDNAVGPLYLAAVEQSLREAGFEPVVGVIPAGEANKTLTQIGRLYDAFLPAGNEAIGLLAFQEDADGVAHVVDGKAHMEQPDGLEILIQSYNVP